MRNVFIMYVLILIVLFFCFQNLKPDLNINQTKQEPNITKVIFINNSDEKEIARLNQKIENQQNIIDSLRYNLSELMLSKQKNPNNYRGLYNFTNNKIEIFCNQAPQRVLSTCVHEVGHYIQDEYFFYNDFKEYQEIIKNGTNKHIALVSHEIHLPQLWEYIYGKSPIRKIANLEIVPLLNYQITNDLDRWIWSSLHELAKEVANEMDKHLLDSATRIMMSFVDKLTNWFIRRSRRRFWAGGM